MESASKQVRIILPLLKARIVDRSPKSFKLSFGQEYGSPTTITVMIDTTPLDLRDGDLLTLYTEVLSAHAKPS